MEYTINKLSKMANVSARTLRYYDVIGLLKPARVNSSGYRIYGQNEIDLLQQILFYKELGVNLDSINKIINSPSFDREKTLSTHLSSLLEKREHIDVLIRNVTKTISTLKGETIMTDIEKFEGLKQSLIDENESKYGLEIREKYGDDLINASYSNIKEMTQQEYEGIEMLTKKINDTIKEAFLIGDPAGEIAQKACDLHKEWLCYYYNNYSKEYHRGLGEMYVSDERFKKYYDNITKGCAEFLRDAINIYCED